MKFICASAAEANVPTFFSNRFAVEWETHPLTAAHFPDRKFILSSDASVCLTVGSPLPMATRIPGTHSGDVVALESLQAGVDGLWTTYEVHRPGVQIALSTADCLAVSLVCEIRGQTWGCLFHAGWRGYTLAIHHCAWDCLQNWLKIEGFDTTEALANTFAFISPAIFGATYECGMDVKERLLDFETTRLSINRAHDNTFFHQLFNGQALGVTSPNPNKIYPDLQLMMAYEMASLWHVPSSHITIIRENTFGHLLVPSYRYRTLFGGNIKERVFSHLQLGPN